jgi:prolyl-tRNA editing enzyme YbaK/EbsC (Cys-tRNA(Pro) deacylase)
MSAARSHRSVRCSASPVILDRAGTEPALVAVGGGAHGVNVHVTPTDLIAATDATVADISIPEATPRN